MNIDFYSIIVPTYNRCDEIEELIQSVNRLQFDKNRFELIIVDDGSNDNTAERVDDLRKATTLNIRFITQNNQGPGAARNTGMDNARGDFFIFIDSDCTVSTSWLFEIDNALRSSAADAFGGPDSYLESFPPLLKAIDYSMTSFITTGGIRGHKKKKLGKFYPRSFNMGLSAWLYKQIGGFGSLRHGQDIEFSNRIIKSGAHVALIDKAIVYHKRRTSIVKFFKQVFNWGVARINLFKLDKAMLEPVHTLPALALWIFLCLLAASFFSTSAKLIFTYSISFALILILISSVHSLFLYKNLKTALFVLIIIPIQIIGYGLGFSYAFFKRVLLGQGEVTGFTKKYYR